MITCHEFIKILEASQITISNISLILQVIIFILLLAGVYFIKGIKRNLKKHRLFTTIAIILHAILVLLIMIGPFFSRIGYLIENFYNPRIMLAWIHGMTGALAIILGISFLIKHPRNTIRWMRTTLILWLIALLIGVYFSI